MIQYRRHILIFHFCLLLLFTTAAQDKYRAVHWGYEQGLSNGEVYRMIKDVNGFLWVATNTDLNRFDGMGFKAYTKDAETKTKAFAGDRVSGLAEDSLHNIWIGTNRGLLRYDIVADSFRKFNQSASYHQYKPFWATQSEVFYIDYVNDFETRIEALNVKNFEKRTLVNLQKPESDSLLDGVSVFNIIFDSASNSLWLEKGKGNWSHGGLLQILLSTGERKEFTWPCYRNIPNHVHFQEGMRYDRKRNSIWISSTDGLLEFSLSGKKFNKIAAFDKWTNGRDYFPWAGIDIDPGGQIWVNTAHQGMIIYDPITQSANLLFADDSVRQHTVSDANVSIYCDPTGMVWSGFWERKGIYQFVPRSGVVTRFISDERQRNGLSHTSVWKGLNAGDGKLWLATPAGINVFDSRTNLFDLLGEKGIPKNKFIYPVTVDTEMGKAWILAFSPNDFRELYEMDLKTKICRPVTFKDGENKSVSGFSNIDPRPYQRGCIISAHYKDQLGIFILHNDSAVARQVFSLPHEKSYDLRVSPDNDQLFFLKRPDSANDLSFRMHEGNWKIYPNAADSIKWQSFTYNKVDQSFWFVTDFSLIHFTKDLQQIKTYTRKDGLPGFQIQFLIADNQGKIWFFTDHSIHRLDVNTGLISALSEEDGFMPQNFSFWAEPLKDDNGDIYIMAGEDGNGFDRISPAKFIYPAASVYMQTLRINQSEVPLTTGINNLKELVLKHFQNNITIDAGILDFYSRGRNHIRYKLGEQSNWQYPSNNVILYEGLAPGSYLLIVQASNSANDFNGPEKLLLININPPWWQTWWAYSLLALVIAFSIWSFIRYRSRSLKEKNILLEEKVMHRTKELKHSLEELRETQTQLIQREKMASLGELTAGIAHEIQNPLNFMNNFSEVNAELIDELNHELDKGNLDDARAISKDIKDNELKINHHGRRADSIVKGMLQHSRASTGVKEPTDINALADEYLRLSYHGLRAKDKSFNADFETRFDTDLRKINVIPQDIGRVLLNIYNNAFYAVHEKQKQLGDSFKPKVSVHTRLITSATASQAEIRIRDNGIGIPQKVLDKIFQPFFTTKPTGEGTGLGLSLSYDIITKAHGGTLRVDTKEGEYTEFIIEMPVTVS